MTQPEIEIRRAWRHIVVQRGQHRAHIDGYIDGYIDSLLARYREPHRRYHTATHIMWVLRHLLDISSGPQPSATYAQPLPPAPSAELVAAALYHDAIYDPRADDNEAQSAVLATADLAELGWEHDRCGLVEALILATAGHLAGDDAARPDTGRTADTAILLDADLAILGAEPAAYQAYVNGIRAEYAHVTDAGWRAGRASVLQHFLDRPRLFTTEYMYAARERRARANMGAELAALAGSGD